MKTGSAYVPLDPSYPKERLRHMLEDARATLVLAQPHLASALPAGTAQVLELDASWAAASWADASWAAASWSAASWASASWSSASWASASWADTAAAAASWADLSLGSASWADNAGGEAPAPDAGEIDQTELAAILAGTLDP